MWWLVAALIPLVTYAQYYGKPLGSFVHSDGTSGDVYVADAKTLMVVNFNRKGEGCKTFLAGPTLAGLPEDRLSTHKEGVMLEISKRRSRPKRQAFNFVPKIPAMNSGHHILDWPFEFGHLRVDNGSPGFGAPSSPLDVETDEGSGEGRSIRLNVPATTSTLAAPATTTDPEATRAPLRIFTLEGGSSKEGITTDIAGPRRTSDSLTSGQIRPLQPVPVNADRNRTSAERKPQDILPVISAGGQPIQIQPIRRIEHAPPRSTSFRTSAERASTAATSNSDLSAGIPTFGPWDRPTGAPRATTEAPQPFTHVLGAEETRRTWGPLRRETAPPRTTTAATPAGPLVVVFGGSNRNQTEDADKSKGSTTDPSQKTTRILNQNARRQDADGSRTTIDFRAVQKPLPDTRREGLGLVSNSGGGALFVLGDGRNTAQPNATRSASRWARPTAPPAGLSDARESTEGVTVVFGSGHEEDLEVAQFRTPFPPLSEIRRGDRQPAPPATPAAPSSRSAPRRVSSAPSSSSKTPQSQSHEDFVDSAGVMRVSFGSGAPIQLPSVRAEGGFAPPAPPSTTEEPGAFIDDEGVLRFQFGNPEEALERERRRQDSTELLDPIPTRRPKPIVPWTTLPYPTTKMGAQFDLPEGAGEVLMVQFPDGFNLKDFSWFGVFDHCLQEREGYVNIPQSFDPPKEESIRGIRGWTADVNSGNIIILNCNTLVIQNFTYSNAQDKDAYIYVGMGEFPNHILQKVRTEVVGEASKQPLRQYRGQDVMIRLPESWRIFDTDWLAVFNPDENVSYGHTLIPSAWVPPCEDLV